MAHPSSPNFRDPATRPSAGRDSASNDFDFELRPRGLLDQRGAETLWDEVAGLLERGAERLRIDARELGPVLPEGLRRLAERLAACPSPGPAAALAFVALNDAAAIQFQLQGYAVDERTAWLGFGAEAWPDPALLSGLRLERESGEARSSSDAGGAFRGDPTDREPL